MITDTRQLLLQRGDIQAQILFSLNIFTGVAGAGVILGAVVAPSAGVFPGIAVGIVCVVGGFIWLQAQLKTLTRALTNLRAIAEAAAQQYLPDIVINHQADEITQIDSILNQMGKRLQQLQQQLTERTSTDPQLQAELQEVLGLLAEMEAGNLAIYSQNTGIVGDRVNRTIQRLAQLIKNLEESVQQVSGQLAELQATAQTLHDRTQAQEAYIEKTQTTMHQLAQLVQSAEGKQETVAKANELAELAVRETEQGINRLTTSINSLQKGTELIVQRIRNLDEFVTLAKQFVLDQKRLASLTQVLAMNASMVAARAVEQREPDQFASVAREFAAIASQVNNLATQTNQGLVVLQQRTGFVEVVVSGIDKDVRDVTSLVSQFTDSVQQSQQSFDYLKQVAAQMAEVEETITSTNSNLAKAIAQALHSSQDLTALWNDLLHETIQAQQQAQALQTQLAQLQHSLAKFRLPEVEAVYG